MIKTKKIIAILIAILMLMSNFLGLLGNIVIAAQSNVTVVFSPDNDSNLVLKEDGYTLTYTCGGTSYDFKLVQQVDQEEQALPITANYNANGNTFTVSGISSNSNVKIYSPIVDLGKVQIFYSGNSIGLVPKVENVNANYYSQYLEDIGDVNHYQFRIQEVPNNPNPDDYNNTNFTVSFGTNTWTIEGETTRAKIDGAFVGSDPVVISGSKDIELSDWNPEIMDARATFVLDEGDEFSTLLGVRQENGKYYTRIADAEADHLPGNTCTFSVVKHEEAQHGDPQMDIASTVFPVDFGTATWEVRNKTTQASVTIDDQNLELTKGRVDIRGDQIIKLSNWDSKLMQASIAIVDPKLQEEEYFRTRLDVSKDGETKIMDIKADNIPWGEEGMYVLFYVERYQGELPENNLPEPNTKANVVTVTSSNAHPKSYIDARISINGFPVLLGAPEPGEEVNLNNVPATTTINDFDYFYDENENNGKVRITFSAIFLNKYVGSVYVNGQEFVIYDPNRAPEENLIDYSNGTDWLLHYNGQEVGFDVLVNKADRYDIVADLVEMPGEEVAIGNFLWSDAANEVGSDGYIGNATLEVLQVKYEIDINYDGDYNDEGEQVTVNFDEDGNYNDPYDIIEYAPYGEVGSLVVPAYSECIMKITPDYGYQVLAFGANENPDIVGENISEFKFIAHKGNFHLGAKVVAVEDVVDAVSRKVKSGSVAIGQNEIDSGSFVLSVDDFNPTQQKTDEFEARAINVGDYTIDTYLDISLDQVWYKGTEENLWTNEIPELNDYATIELELSDDMKGKDIKVIHNIHNGENYEVIDATYNEKTNTITFKAKSFSNYAIAVKDNQEEIIEEEKYTITAGDFTVIFTDEEGHEFNLIITELLHLTPEELAAMGITEEEYETAKKEITEALKEYGTILNVYDISVYDDKEDYSHFGEIEIKIKMTDAMKKFNTFKLICIDNDPIRDEDIVELKEVDGYLVGKLKHLSNYALVAKNVESTKNPKTGDNIIFHVTMFVVAIVGMGILLKFKK